MGSRGFWRRHVYRVAAAYVVVGWLLIQAATQVFPVFHLPDWIEQAVVLVILVGFPIALVVAWAFDVTPAGIVKTDAAAEGVAVTSGRPSRRAGVVVGVIGVVLAAVVGVAWWQLPAPRARSSLTSSAQVAETRSPDGAGAAAAKPPDSAVKAASSGLHIAGSPDEAQRNPGPIIAAPIPAKSIAVLPFENLSTDKGNAYFADGIQDLILTKLADIGDLKVISRTSTMKYASHPDDLKTIGQQLGVATILEGSVQKAGKQVLINVQLIDAKTDSHIWAQSYQRNLTNIFGVEGEVAGKVAQALNAKLTAAETARVASVPTANPQAYDHFLRALHFNNEAAKGDWANYLPQAIAAAQKAVAADPKFALAWAGLSSDRTRARYWGVNRSEANLRAAEGAAKRALALALKLPEAHIAMAGVQRFLYHDIQAAHDQAQQAVDLRPNDPGALSVLAISDAHLGHFHAAATALRRATELDPTDSFSEFQLGLMLWDTGDYAAARQAQRRALAINPQNVQAYMTLSRLDVIQNADVVSATRVLDHMAPGTPVNVDVVTARIRLLLYQRQYATARTLALRYTGKFTHGPAALTLTAARANIEWLAGKLPEARVLYRTMIGMITASGNDLNGYDHAELGLAYARLGNADAAMRQVHMAIAMDQRSHEEAGIPIDKMVVAKIQLALGRNSKAIDTLTQLLADDSSVGSGFRNTRLTPSLLNLDPVWDPIRHDPRFQALLKKYAGGEPAATHDNPPAAVSN
ncbi:MAG: tetratricopeptide repeat protein [Rhodanobacteraceae bacterium]